jgi:hypothetical protein
MNSDQLTVFLEYTRRYETIAADLPPDLRTNLGTWDREYSKKKDQLSESVQQAIVRYFNLCSEEFYLHSVGLIDQPVWQLWKSYMEAILKTELFTRAWKQLRERYIAQAPFQEFMDALAGK